MAQLKVWLYAALLINIGWVEVTARKIDAAREVELDRTDKKAGCSGHQGKDCTPSLRAFEAIVDDQEAAEFPSLVQVGMHTFGRPIEGHVRGHVQQLRPELDQAQPQSIQAFITKSLAQTAAWAPASSLSLRVVSLFVVLAALCVMSVGFYAQSVMSPPSLLDTPPMAAPADASMKRSATSQLASDDSTLGLHSPSGTEAATRRRGFGRRATVTISELKHWKAEEAEGTLSEFSFVVNMFADLGPSGFLPLAHGLKDTGYIPGFLILISFYFICVFTMYSVAETSRLSGAKDYASQWGLCVSARTKWIPVAMVVAVTFGTLISYSCFFADIFTGVMPSFGLEMSRTNCLLAFTLFPTLPLCLVKNLSALSSSSSFAVLAVLFTAGVMTTRWLDGSYVEGGKYYGDLEKEFLPNVPADHLFDIGLPSLALVNSLALGFLTHYNACKYYRELRNHTPQRFAQYTRLAMGMVAVLFVLIMVAGFQTFGTNCNSVILKNYSRKDTAVNISRLGMGFSLVASFPLMFSGLREAALTLMKMTFPENEDDWDLVLRQDLLSMVLLAMITAAASLVTDAGMVVGLVGALCGISIIYIVPSVLYSGAIQTFLREDGHAGILNFTRFLIVLGSVLAVGGVVSTLIF